jgi:hypothetical protein
MYSTSQRENNQEGEDDLQVVEAEEEHKSPQLLYIIHHQIWY